MKRRWQRHVVAALNRGSTYHFHNAIRLYGKDAWDHQILCKNIPTLDEAQKIEQTYIQKLDTFHNGYNSTMGGEGTVGLKGKLSPHYGKPKTDHVKSCLKQRMLGNTIAKDTLQKRIRTRRNNLPKYKWVHFEYGVEELTTVELCKKYNLCISHINAVLRGDSITCRGWQVYKGSHVKIKKQKVMPICIFEHPDFGVFIGTNNELCNEFPELSSGNISKIVRGLRSHHKGWKFKGVHQAREKEKITLKANHDKKSHNEIKEKSND